MKQKDASLTAIFFASFYIFPLLSFTHNVNLGQKLK
jgi:hypothetical protein